jgi:hypothetical protein
MKKQTPLALAAALLLAGVTAASAAGMAPSAGHSLALSSAQRKTAWKDLYMGSLNQKTPAGFSAKIGAVLPKGVTVAPVTAKAARAVPALKRYDFAMVQKKLVIVNPSNRKITDVISG